MTNALATKWLNRILHEEGVPLDKVYRDKLAARISAMVASETADALASVANVIAASASAMRGEVK